MLKTQGQSWGTWIRLKQWPKQSKNSEREVCICDLFCGCGGMTLGAWEALRQAGIKTKIHMALDVSTEALAIYENNFRSLADLVINKDISQVFDGKIGTRTTKNERNILKKAGKIDILLAGPPCQGHSDLNNFTRRNDPRNSLYLRAIRAVEVLKPKVVIIENVPAIIHDKKKTVTIAIKALGAMGFLVKEFIFKATQFGIPQERKRHVLIGLKGIEEEFVLQPQQRAPTVGDFISEIEDEEKVRSGVFFTSGKMSVENKKRTKFLFQNGLFNLPNELRPNCHRLKKHSYISMYGRLSWDKPAQTITSGFGSIGQGRFIHPHRPRTVTPHEAARIQGFPDFFNFSLIQKRTAMQEIIGNAVPPQICFEIISEILKRKII